MKLLLILNESSPGKHKDIHQAVDKLVSAGILSRTIIYPYLSRQADGLSEKDINSEILAIARNLGPSAILWCHTDRLTIEDETLDHLKKSGNKPAMGYWDMDIYHWFYKPLPEKAKKIVRHCDAIFSPGIDQLVIESRKLGKPIYYVPLPTDKERFTASKVKQPNYLYDVVMIGNYAGSRWPLKTFPGSRLRKQVASLLYKKMGRRFAVFGNNWKLPCSKGPIPFERQTELYSNSRIMVGTNNLHARYYFSDRLPIAMSSGITVVHNHEDGFEEIFPDMQPPYFFRTPENAWKIIKKLLDTDQDKLREKASLSRSFALEKFVIEKLLTYIIEVLRMSIGEKHGYPKTAEIINPWINKGYP